jgi:hypothetical protein
MKSRILPSTCVALLVGLAMGFAARAEEAAAIRTGWVDVQFYSIDPSQGIESYRRGSSGGAGLGGTFGASLELTDASLTINVSVHQRSGRFLVDLQTEKLVGEEVSHPPEFNREIDVTDLAPFACELGKGRDGRIQRLTIVPVLKSQSLPKRFRISELDLTNLNLSRLPVILNEQEFIGTAGVDGGEVISLSIAGLAEIELSLLPFADAVPEGELRGGTLSIRHEQDELQISGVTNGERRETLDGGPYQVFVRWQPPQLSLPQYVSSLPAQVDEIRKQAEQGDMYAQLLLPKFEAMVAVLAASVEAKSRTACLYGSGARQLSSKERSN